MKDEIRQQSPPVRVQLDLIDHAEWALTVLRTIGEKHPDYSIRVQALTAILNAAVAQPLELPQDVAAARFLKKLAAD